MTRSSSVKHDISSDAVGQFAFGDLFIDHLKLLRIQGYRDFSRIRPQIKAAAVSASKEVEAVIEPMLYYRLLSVKSCDRDRLLLANGSTFASEVFPKFLSQARQVVVFVLTMGQSLDRAIHQAIHEDQLLHALFLETAGWLGIEAATKQFSIHLRSLAKDKEARLSLRLGPGYRYNLGDRSVTWPLDQQKALFELFLGQVHDVALLDSCAMQPKISRSGLFGFLPLKTKRLG